jgi:hypothetical protein
MSVKVSDVIRKDKSKGSGQWSVVSQFIGGL